MTELLIEKPHAIIDCPYCDHRAAVNFQVEDYPDNVKQFLITKYNFNKLPYQCEMCQGISLFDWNNIAKIPEKLSIQDQQQLKNIIPFNLTIYLTPIKDNFEDYWSQNIKTRPRIISKPKYDSWWILKSGKILHFADLVHAEFAATNLDLFELDEDVLRQKHSESYRTSFERFVMDYILDNGIGLRCGTQPSTVDYNVLDDDEPMVFNTRQLDGYIEGLPALINRLKNVAYDSFIKKGVSRVWVDLSPSGYAIPVIDIDKFRRKVY